MALASLLRKRIHFHVGLGEPTLPTVQAAGEDSSPRSGVGGSFSLGSLIPVLGMAITLIGIFTNLNGKLVEHDAKIAQNAADNSKTASSLTNLFQRYNNEVVSRSEISDRFAALQQNQLQIYSTLLSKGCH